LSGEVNEFIGTKLSVKKPPGLDACGKETFGRFASYTEFSALS